MNAIGGYLELELATKGIYHQDAIALNSGRNCLVYLIKAKNIKKLHLPHYICDSMIVTAQKSGVAVELYSLKDDFTPDLSLYTDKEDEYVLYVNYWGLCEDIVSSLIAKKIHLIVDNTQAFFSPPREGIDTMYSTRKFFGVPDGGYLYTSAPILELEQDESYTRFKHLLMRIDTGIEPTLEHHQENETTIDSLPLKKMSRLTERVLKSIDYTEAKQQRVENMNIYHAALGSQNTLSLSIDPTIPSHTYPFLVEDGEFIRQKLLAKGIYPLQYWKKVLQRVNSQTLEYRLAANVIGLPVDQRYKKKDIEYVLSVISV